jgi:carbonic anhydrase
MEYGCKVSGAKLIVVMGHQYCGAIKSAIDNVKLGNITQLLAKIKPAIAASADFKGEKTRKRRLCSYVALNNVKQNYSGDIKRSPLLKEMADKGEIKIVSRL